MKAMIDSKYVGAWGDGVLRGTRSIQCEVVEEH